jgi:DNA repair photolyase
MGLSFQEYRAYRIVKVHRHVDGPWFWGKYSAHPYVGCRSGCEFCYVRGSRYLGKRDPATFDKVIQVKINAADLLKKEIGRLQPEIIACGDWQQPAEGRYRLSRAILEIVRDARFPLFIVERSPLLVRDLDLIVEINRQTWAGVVFSMSHVDPRLKQAFEPRSPGLRQRLTAMSKLASAGILVGTALMPVIPVVGDDERHLRDAIRATAEHGGSFVMAGGLTMDGVQAQRTLDAACRLDPTLEELWRKLYRWCPDSRPSYGPDSAYNARLGMKVRELCLQHGLLDRMPRYIAPGPLAVNKRISELFLKTYDLELEQADAFRVWAYRKAAWTVDELQESIAVVFGARGESGLRELPGIGKDLAQEISAWLRQEAGSGGSGSPS